MTLDDKSSIFFWFSYHVSFEPMMNLRLICLPLFQPIRVTRPKRNEYAVANRPKLEHIYNTPVVEEYADMSLAAKDVCKIQAGYENLSESEKTCRDTATEVPASAEYEEMGLGTPPESGLVVAENYLEPKTLSKGDASA